MTPSILFLNSYNQAPLQLHAPSFALNASKCTVGRLSDHNALAPNWFGTALPSYGSTLGTGFKSCIRPQRRPFGHHIWRNAFRQQSAVVRLSFASGNGKLKRTGSDITIATDGQDVVFALTVTDASVK
jgi:hypothetical protein